MILDPYGRVLVEIKKADDGMAVADIEGALLQHATGRTWITARRPELYGLLTRHTGLERDMHELKFEE
jgi:predicted amidohydrolase